MPGNDIKYLYVNLLEKLYLFVHGIRKIFKGCTPQERKDTMSKELNVFVYVGKPVRITKDEKGEPWFVAKDVCEILQYGKDVHAILKTHCKYAKLFKAPYSGDMEIPPRGVLVIPESDLYRLIMRSNMPEAERFQDWVVETVLPQIRKTGGYFESRFVIWSSFPAGRLENSLSI